MMTNKFNSGDRVQLISVKNHAYSGDIEKGDTGIILENKHWSRSDWAVVRLDKNGTEYGLSKNDERWEHVNISWRKLLTK